MCIKAEFVQYNYKLGLLYNFQKFFFGGPDIKTSENIHILKATVLFTLRNKIFKKGQTLKTPLFTDKWTGKQLLCLFFSPFLYFGHGREDSRVSLGFDLEGEDGVQYLFSKDGNVTNVYKVYQKAWMWG